MNNILKRTVVLVLVITLAMATAACAGLRKTTAAETEATKAEDSKTKSAETFITDAEAQPSSASASETENAHSETQANESLRVVALGSSLADMWQLAGGNLVGTTEDSLEEFPDLVSEGVASVGTVKTPSLEKILALDPHLVILSADLSDHVALKEVLEQAGVESYYAQIKKFSDYLEAMEIFIKKTGREDLFEKNALAIGEQIQAELAHFTLPKPPPDYLLLRMHSSGGKAVARDQIAVDILDDLGAVNIAAENSDLLSELSLEAILLSDPDFIFVVSMGDEGAAMQTLEQMFSAQEAWKKLSAVQNQRVIQLPKALFHNKPNAKWGEAYVYLIDILSTRE